ncbi:MAG TPA: hypothetical protein VF401_04435 [Candidatus Saccharimonadales bacterium]
MARLPTPGKDEGTWGYILNAFLSVEHDTDGSLKNVARPSDVAAKYSLPSGGIPATDLSQPVQDTLNTAGTFGYYTYLSSSAIHLRNPWPSGLVTDGGGTIDTY